MSKRRGGDQIRTNTITTESKCADKIDFVFARGE